MSNNLDDFLNSLGIETAVPANDEAVEALDNIVVAADITQQEPIAAENNPQNLSNDDFDDILGEYGFSRTQDAEAEEVTEEESREEEVVENTSSFEGFHALEETETASQEYRDLDAEEDAEWERAIEDRVIVPSVDNSHWVVNETDSGGDDREVHFHMPDGSQIDVPIHNEAQELANNNEDNADVPLLPQNSPTLLMDDSTTRFSGAEWFNEIQRKTIIIAGQGGIGRMKNFL